MRILLIFALLISIFSQCQSPTSKTPTKQFIYFDNGNVRREFFVIDGKREGTMTDFYIDGKVRMVREMKNDIQIGKSIIYHEDGQTIREVQYFDEQGNRYRSDTLWYKNGKIEFFAEFANSKKNGVLSRFDTTGILIYSAKFKDDSLLTVLKEDALLKK
jgi:antitoxin component YwqK of YwqJK toxin-antitoxin module